MARSDLWEEFLISVPAPQGLRNTIETILVCGLCGNTGIVETHVKTPYGEPCGVQQYCICPNGRSMKRSKE